MKNQRKPPFFGETVVITGASSGIGKATAEAFAAQGADLVLAARGQEALQETAEVCRKLGATVIAVPTDTSVAEEVQHLVNEAIEFSVIGKNIMDSYGLHFLYFSWGKE